MKMVNPDIQKERDTCSFNVPELTNIIQGGQEQAHRRRQFAELIAKDPILSLGDFHKIHLSYSERYERALQKFSRWTELGKKYSWSDEEKALAMQLIGFDVGLSVHFIMFIPALEKLATEVQKNKWLPQAKSFQIIGTYCQTELGHGTDLRHLETRADYDKTRQEFVVTMPRRSSMKWWPGGLGLTVNHVLLLAHLYIDGKHYGLQPFMVQIRDVKSHMPLPGVEVGDIGPRMTTATSDNGYLILRDIRIPRENMLMRYNEVTPNGQFIQRGSDVSNYGTMILIRANICGIAWRLLSVATTIATRYSAVRRQTEMKPGEPEQQILDYQTQQMKLFPSLATSFACLFTHKYITRIYEEITSEMDAGDQTRLPELHIQSAGFKALTTDLASVQAEVLRKSCGGHGYLMSSGIPSLVFDLAASGTYEGENTVLYLQVGRYLLKQLNKAQNGSKVGGSLSMLNEQLPDTPISDKKSLCMADVDVMMEAFNRRTHYFLALVGQSIHSDLVGGLDMADALNKSLENLVRTAKMYMDGCMVAVFYRAFSEASCSAELKNVLFRLFYFHMVHRIVLQSGDFLQCRAFTIDQIMAIKREEIRVLALLRPDAVGLVDSFNYTDEELMSTLGRFDGEAYEALYRVAQKSPLNASKVNPGVKKYLLPLNNTSKL